MRISALPAGTVPVVVPVTAYMTNAWPGVSDGENGEYHAASKRDTMARPSRASAKRNSRGVCQRLASRL